MNGMNRTVQIRSRSRSQSASDGSYSDSWSTMATVWAEVQDILPSRAESITEGVNIARRPCRVRFYYRDDVTPDMLFRVLGRAPEEGDRDLRIIAGPAELGFRHRVEFVAEDLTSEGVQP